MKYKFLKNYLNYKEGDEIDITGSVFWVEQETPEGNLNVRKQVEVKDLIEFGFLKLILESNV